MENTTHSIKLSPPHVRVGDVERQDAASQLQTHFAAGRISWEELDERLGQAWAARTGADLSVLFSDLPSLQQPPTAMPEPKRAFFRHLPRFHPLLVVLSLLIVSAVVVTHGIILLPFAYWFIAGSRGRRRFGAGRGHGHRHGHRHSHDSFHGSHRSVAG